MWSSHKSRNNSTLILSLTGGHIGGLRLHLQYSLELELSQSMLLLRLPVVDDLGYVMLVSHPLLKTIACHLYLSFSPLVDANPGTESEFFQSLPVVTQTFPLVLPHLPRFLMRRRCPCLHRCLLRGRNRTTYLAIPFLPHTPVKLVRLYPFPSHIAGVMCRLVGRVGLA